MSDLHTEVRAPLDVLRERCAMRTISRSTMGWSVKKKGRRLEAEFDPEPMARGALDCIHEMLDSGGIPRGTFADDHVRNLVCFFNWQADALKMIVLLGDETARTIAKAMLDKIEKAKIKPLMKHQEV